MNLKSLFLALTLCLPSAAKADAIAVSSFGSSGEQTVTLHDTDGPCVGTARLAVWHSRLLSKSVNGCYTINMLENGTAIVTVSYLDSDRSDIPLVRFKPVEKL